MERKERGEAGRGQVSVVARLTSQDGPSMSGLRAKGVQTCSGERSGPPGPRANRCEESSGQVWVNANRIPSRRNIVASTYFFSLL
jgi:hypothetical protein